MKITKKTGVELAADYKLIKEKERLFDSMITNRLVILSKRYVKKIPGALLPTSKFQWENHNILTKLEYIKSIEATLNESEPKQLTLDLNY